MNQAPAAQQAATALGRKNPMLGETRETIENGKRTVIVTVTLRDGTKVEVDKFGPKSSAEERLGSIKGQERTEFFHAHYVGGKGVLIPLFCKKTKKRCAWRHVKNDRDPGSTTEEYKAKYSANGFNIAFRGEPAAVKKKAQNPEEDEPEYTWHFVAAGSLLTAVYQHIEEEPNSHYAIRARDEGFPDVTEIIEECPDDMLAWYIDESNEWHGGAKGTSRGPNPRAHILMRKRVLPNFSPQPHHLPPAQTECKQNKQPFPVPARKHGLHPPPPPRSSQKWKSGPGPRDVVWGRLPPAP